ncbi:MAG: dihydrofolate reductase [Actinophytocola sp.]|uniref:dihydrofolate reductase family protein n=1 Tax=Actinophytocola sp. TaxID=1872138 RepID=UPI001322783C|nr:dihydrofolate reductase family protein [Actinophytocola sp.]MPZ80164.1 dihydrofolate reductase [Actinophytocola sp.]
MRKLTYMIAMSVDGFIAGPGGEYDMYPTPEAYLGYLTSEYPETIPSHVRPHLGIADAPNKLFDTVVQGRVTYQPAIDIGVPSPYAHLRQLVVSTTLSSPDPAVEIVAGDPVARVRELKAEDGLGIYLAGGARLAGALKDEIDEVIVKLYPIMLGTGIPMINGEFGTLSLERSDITTFDSRHVILRYIRA